MQKTTRLFSLLVLWLLVVGCAGQPPATEETGAAQSAAASEQPLYVDVRTPQEYSEGHVKGSLLIPYDQMEARWQELAEHKDKPIVLYCRSGRRSQIALDVLKEKGFTNLKNGGGFDDLARQGVPTEK